MDSNLKEEMDTFIRDRDKLLDELNDQELTPIKFKEIMIEWTNMIMYHVSNALSTIQTFKSEQKRLNNRFKQPKKDNSEFQTKKSSKNKKKEQSKLTTNFEKILHKYKNKNRQNPEEIKKTNAWKDWEMTEDTYYTKSKWPVHGLHLVVHHYGNQREKAFNKGFTILKDPRFLKTEDSHWPWRIELIAVYDRIRKTKGYIVEQNEFGNREWYS